MNWHTDPPNFWTALYRIFVIVALVYMVWAHANNPNVPDLIPSVGTAISGSVRR